MYPYRTAPPLRSFSVQLGVTRTIVKCEHLADVIRLARRQLCHDLPRMWDVIHGAEDSKFLVEEQSN